jgi:PPK2 family polyphosphate:nucleotide phosphotransferase
MSLRDKLRVPVGADFDLPSIDPDGTPGLPGKDKEKKHDKAWGRERLIEIGADLATFQEQLYATAKVGDSHDRVLLVLQAMDCGGKDGTTKRVAGTMNPAGLTIVGFGKPTPEELAHDFLWRIHKAVPEPGQIGVFNRSHYEDVLIARVHNLVPPEIWEARYDRINAFEAALNATGVTMIKVMLHISKDEQATRLGERLADPTKFWKYNPADLDERGFWDDYQHAYTVVCRPGEQEVVSRLGRRDDPARHARRPEPGIPAGEFRRRGRAETPGRRVTRCTQGERSMNDKCTTVGGKIAFTFTA